MHLHAILFGGCRCSNPENFNESIDPPDGQGHSFVQIAKRNRTAINYLKALRRGAFVEFAFCEIRIDPFLFVMGGQGLEFLPGIADQVGADQAHDLPDCPVRTGL